MFKRILVVYSEKKTKNHLNCIKEFFDFFEKREEEVFFLCVNELKEDLIKEEDFILTIGGDGTFIRVSHFIKNQFILGINSDKNFSEGALTSLPEKVFENLEKIFQGNFKIEQRERIELIKNNKVLKNLALNEVYVGALTQFHTSRYEIVLNDTMEEQRSSGILFVTSTGSSAWYKSAGGERFFGDKIKFLVREVFFSRLFKPKLISGEIGEGEKISVISKMHEGGVLVLDSNKIVDFNFGEKVELRLSKDKLNVIKI